MPARTNTQPRLSTYWLAVNDAGGISDGARALRNACALAAPPVKPATRATVDKKAALRNEPCITIPTKYSSKMQNNPYFVKGLCALFSAKHAVARIP